MLLVIGSKQKSSWSLRPWLLMKQFEIQFEEKLILLDQSKTTEEILRYSPSAKVPVLLDGSISVWESLAIAEYLNEKFPELQMWPADKARRAKARAISNEMHGGFSNLRNHMPHELNTIKVNFDWSNAKDDVERVIQIWQECLSESNGPFLFGEFSIADAMFAPVVNRFVTYGIFSNAKAAKLAKDYPACISYMKAIAELKALKTWIEEASLEK